MVSWEDHTNSSPQLCIQTVHVLREVANVFSVHLLNTTHGCRGSKLSAFLFQGLDTVPGCAECCAALSAAPANDFPWIERHWCRDRSSAAGSDVWVAVEVTAVGVSQSHKEIPLHAGSSVWTAMERVQWQQLGDDLL